MNRHAILDALHDEAGQEALFGQADAVRREQLGDEAQLRGVVHFSNYCRCNDLYCGLLKDNGQCKRFPHDRGRDCGHGHGHRRGGTQDSGPAIGGRGPALHPGDALFHY